MNDDLILVSKSELVDSICVALVEGIVGGASRGPVDDCKLTSCARASIQDGIDRLLKEQAKAGPNV